MFPTWGQVVIHSVKEGSELDLCVVLPCSPRTPLLHVASFHLAEPATPFSASRSSVL